LYGVVIVPVVADVVAAVVFVVVSGGGITLTSLVSTVILCQNYLIQGDYWGPFSGTVEAA
jgi:hypothetical protein